MTRWYPDTCDCVIDYSDDGNFTLVSVQKKCAKHAAVAQVDHLATLFSHNRLKNRAMKWLTDKYGSAAFDADGNLLVSINYDRGAAADNDPVLVTGLKVLGVTSNQLSTLQTQVDNAIGANKVVLSL